MTGPLQASLRDALLAVSLGAGVGLIFALGVIKLAELLAAAARLLTGWHL